MFFGFHKKVTHSFNRLFTAFGGWALVLRFLHWHLVQFRHVCLKNSFLR